MARQASKLKAVPVWLARLRMELRQLAMPVLSSSRRGLLSVSFEVPLDAPVAPPASARDWQFWQHPESAQCLLGLGMARRETASGDQRFAELDAAWQIMQTRWTRITQGRARPRARAFFGFAFDPEFQPGEHWRGFENALIQVPELLVEWCKGRCIITFNCDLDRGEEPEIRLFRWFDELERLLEPETGSRQPRPSCVVLEQPDSTDWKEEVARAVATAAHGVLDKVVLSRSLQLRFHDNVDHRSPLPDLARRYPGCRVLSVSFGGDVLLAATPEKLLHMDGRSIHCDALAGTFPASTRQRDPGMEAHEHAPVVSAIRDALRPYCRSLGVARSPGRMNLNNLAHLYTAIGGELLPQARVLKVLGKLHPTPAVGGMPREQALAWMGERQRRQRGWYTGGFGWLGDNRQADISVLLRCARIQGNEATLYAGAGITRISQPEKELRETELKFQPMLRALTGR
ncbi:isochorismate synthase [Thiolapillus sp.]